MNQVQVDKIHRTIPSTWNELSRKQLVFVSLMFSRNVIIADFLTQSLFKFLEIKRRQWVKMAAEDVYCLGQTLKFLLETVNLTRSVIPTFRAKRFPFTKYYGPNDEMGFCTFGEFIKAQVRFEHYCNTKDINSLNELVAILYRRKKAFWFIRRHFVETIDPRARFLDRNLAIRAKSISTIPHELKYSIFLFFSGIYTSLPVKFPNVYRSYPNSKKNRTGGWATLIISLADGKSDDASLDRIMNSNFYNVFLGLEQKSIEYFEFQNKYHTND